jgi:hypothetical protein
MIRLFRALWIAAILVSCLATAAEALTLRDVIRLSRAGLSEEVIIALIEQDDPAYGLGPDELIELKEAGVSERVQVAMLNRLKQAREEDKTKPGLADTPPAAPAEFPGVLVIGKDPEPIIRSQTVIVTMPVAVPFAFPAFGLHPFGHKFFVPSTGHEGGFGRFINDGFSRPPFTPIEGHVPPPPPRRRR